MMYILITFVVLGVLNSYPIIVTQNLAFQSKQNTLSSQASVISSSLGGLETLTRDGIRQVLTLLDEQSLSRILVTDASGKILYDTSETSSQEMERKQYALFWEIASALSGNDVFHSAYQDGAFLSRAATPILARDSIIGAIYVYEYDADQGSLLLDIQTNLRNISLLISAVVILTSTLFSRAITRRLSELLRAIRIVRKGEYNHRIAMHGKDELNQLVEEFNQLTGRLQTTEELRRRFVSDASHELKTPLSSIRLLADSILQDPSMDAVTTREFVFDIGEEADRLHRITDKLLTLTRMDVIVASPPQPISVRQVVQTVLHMLQPLAKANSISLSFHASEDAIVGANADDLYQIAFNLIENAIKYTLPGGAVTVTLTSQACTILKVEDTGIGIPEEDLPCIFDRFYRVDKARSREAGGTGLGLSIVKDTIARHGGTVFVCRRPEGGTCFEVHFPPYEMPKEAENDT